MLAARHVKRVPRKATQAAGRASAAGRIAAPAAASDGRSGTTAMFALVASLMGVSLLLIAMAAVPPWVLPARVGHVAARYRADLATAGITGAVGLLFGFLIARMA